MKDLVKRILCILLCLTMVIPAVSVKAAETGDDEDIIGNLASLDAGFECSVNKDALEGETVKMTAYLGRVTYTRTHVLASTSLSYSTHHFIVSGKPLKENEYITGANTEGSYNTTAFGTKYGYLALTNNKTDTDEKFRTVTATYEFSALELNKIADELGVKPYEEDGNQFVKVYMSHVFELNPKITDSKGKEIDWSSATEAQKRSALDKWKKSAGGGYLPETC